MKNMSFRFIGLGLIMSFVKLEILLSLWIGITIVISMLVLMIFQIENELKKHISKK